MTYQKKIEELQNKVLDNNTNKSSDEESSTGEDLSEHTDNLNSNVDTFKNIFNRKINNYKENFEQFKNDFKTKDETFNNLLNDKTKNFNEANKITPNVKDQKIDWLNKQINELTEYKKKGTEYENKIRELTNDNQAMEIKLKINQENLDMLKKNLVYKDEAIQSMKSKNTLLEQQCSDMRAFIIKNCSHELKEAFKKSGFY